mgnify:CR=1 FL=1
MSTEPYSYRALSQEELKETRKKEEQERELCRKRYLVENYESNKEWDLRRIEEIKEKAEKDIQAIKNAMEKEAQYIKCPNAKVIVTGIGCNNVIKTLCRAIIHKKVSENDTFINVGYAGSTCFNIGDVVAVRSIKRLRPDLSVTEDAIPITFETFNQCLYAPCYTADEFYEGKKAIPLVDMELYYIKALCNNLISYKIVIC